MTTPPPAEQTPYPAQYPGQPMPPMRPVQGTDGFAITSLVLGLLGGGLLAMIFGFVARSRIKKNGTAGKGMATAGIILGILGLIGFIVAVFLIFFAVDKATDVVAEQAREVGQCFTVDADGALDSVEIVPCSEPHNWEVIAAEQLTDTSLPDEATLSARADALCAAAVETYFAPDVDLNTVGISPLTPTAATWLLGDRTVGCLAGNYDGSLKTGSFAG